MKRLNVGIANGLSKPGMYGDGQTLYLNVARGGTKSWIQRVVIDGKRCDMGLGPYPIVGLREARELAFANRSRIFRGENPLRQKKQAAVAERRESNMPTFCEAASGALEANRHLWRSEKTARNWQQQMARHVLPIIGNMRIDEIGQSEVLRVLTKIWATRPETGRQLRQRIRQTFEWAIAHGFVSANPAATGIDGALPSTRRKREHHKALPHARVAAALTVVDGSKASQAAKLAFRFLTLTAARTTEVREATWKEIDMGQRVWTIPGERMKAGQAHRVPLSDAAIVALEAARNIPGNTGLIFPSPRGKAFSENALNKMAGDLRLGCTPHGLRSSFRDWCADAGHPRELAEAALAHIVAGVEGAYFRSDLIDRRRHLMQAWAEYLGGESAKVVALHG